jgi:hypothetical protein
MVRKEEQQAYFKDQNIQTVLGDLEPDVTSVFTNPIDRIIFTGSAGKMR